MPISVAIGPHKPLAALGLRQNNITLLLAGDGVDLAMVFRDGASTRELTRITINRNGSGSLALRFFKPLLRNRNSSVMTIESPFGVNLGRYRLVIVGLCLFDCVHLFPLFVRQNPVRR